MPAHRVVALLESLTGTAPSVGFVHGLLARTAGLLGEVHDRIREFEKQHGALWTPAPLLAQLASSGKTFAALDREKGPS